MKKTYQKPVLVKRDRLSAIAAVACPISHPCG